MPLPMFHDRTPDQNQISSRNKPDSPSLSHGHPLSDVQAVIGIAAGKGGVGKSTMTVNLALALHAQGYRVGVIDSDLYGPSIRKMLPEDQPPIERDGMIEPAICRGIKMISMAFFRKIGEAAAIRAPIANRLIAHFINNVRWGALDYLLIDFPPGTGDIQLTLSQQAHLIGVVMVTTPQEVALIDVRKAISLFEQVKIPIIGIIENMSYYQVDETTPPLYLFGKGGGERLALETENSFLGHVPLDPSICLSGDQGKSLFEMDPQVEKPVTQVFHRIVEKCIKEINQLKNKTLPNLSHFEVVWKEM